MRSKVQAQWLTALSWDQVDRVMERTVTRGVARRSLEGLRYAGLDDAVGDLLLQVLTPLRIAETGNPRSGFGFWRLSVFGRCAPGKAKRRRVVRGRRRVRAGGRRPPARTSIRRPVIHGRPLFAKHSFRDVKKVTIAAIHPDF